MSQSGHSLEQINTDAELHLLHWRWKNTASGERGIGRFDIFGVAGVSLSLSGHPAVQTSFRLCWGTAASNPGKQREGGEA